MTRYTASNTPTNRTQPTFSKPGLGETVRGSFRGNTRGRGDVRGDFRGRGDIRGRGSLLILVVTVLVIIALIGIAYLQRVRMDQFATARHERSYMNLVINGILAEVGGQMKADVELNQTKNLPLYDYPWTDPNKKEYVATREYAGTIAVNGYKYTNDPAVDDAPEDDRWLASTAPVWVPGANEYRWLHLTNLTGIWLDIPDIGSTINRPTELPIRFDPPQIGRADMSDTDLALSNNPFRGLYFNNNGAIEQRGVDADGDGIPDSRWQWTPVDVRNLGGKKYVMAVRIVDLGSMLNVNTATSLTFEGATMSGPLNSPPQAARGHNPSWVDLSRLMGRVTFTNSSEWPMELSEMLNFRIAKLVSGPQNLDKFASDGTFILESTQDVQTMWEKQGSIYGNTDRNYLMDSEMELRRGGGLNDRTQVSTLEVQMGQQYAAGSQFSRALRQHPAISDDGGVIGAEGSYLDVVDPSNSLSPQAAIGRWFYGDDGGTPVNDPDSAPVKDRQFPAIRHMLTAAGGAGVYAPVLQGVLGDPANPASGSFKFNLNDDWNPSGNVAGKMNELGNQLRTTFKRNGVTLAGYLGLSDSEINDLVDEYIVAIKDYADPDNVPTPRALTSGVGTAYGMERLPFLREVYVQALYRGVLSDTSGRKPWDAGFDPANLSANNYVGWQYDSSDDTRAMVIELGNPFNHKIFGVDPDTTDPDTQGLENEVEIRVWQGGVQIGSWVFNRADTAGNFIPDIDARDSADNGDTLLVVCRPVDKLDTNLIADTGTEDGTNPDIDLNFPADAKVVTTLTDGVLTSGFTPGGGEIEVQLWVNTPDGPRMYDRIELHTNASLPNNVDRVTPGPNPEHQFAQASSARDSEGIKFVVDDGPGTADDNVKFPSDGGAYSPTTDRFGTDTKGNAVTPHPQDPGFYDKLQLPLPDEPMHSLAELGYIHMFGFTDTQTFSERMSSNPAPLFKTGEHFLLVDPRDPLNPGNPHPDFDVVVFPYGVPHAALLMDLFTTVNPRSNGDDNDNDDGDNDLTTSADTPGTAEELFVPGQININTTPMHLMTLGSPLGESLDDAEALSRTIVAYRDEPLREGLRGGSGPHGKYWATGPGIPDVTQIRTPSTTNVPGFLSSRLDTPGIVSLGEVLYLNPGTAENDMLRYGLDGAVSLDARPNVDMYPDPNDATANGPAENQRDDNEELLARFAMLSQAFSVRSDRFVVYGVVRAYNDNAFNRLPAETARFIAVIDRGSMEKSTDNPRVIGFLRIQ